VAKITDVNTALTQAHANVIREQKMKKYVKKRPIILLLPHPVDGVLLLLPFYFGPKYFFVVVVFSDEKTRLYPLDDTTLILSMFFGHVFM
jgi:hypothetical protein